MEEIKEIFKDKNFNEETLKLIDNFIKEFDELFSKYVSKEELIKRIKENLNENVSFTKFEKGTFLGTYNSQDKKISLKEDLSEEKLKAVFFHEMVHCITNHGDYVGFSGELEERTARGITEGFTQYVSKIRNEKYGVTLNSYPILTEQTENLVELLGEEKFLDAAFNDPERLFILMEKEGLIEDYLEAEEFCNHFDVILRHEGEICYGKTAEGKLITAIFGKKSGGSVIDNSKTQIINTLLGKLRNKEISTKEDFKELYERTIKYSKQLDIEGDYKSLSVFWDKIEELEDMGKTREEILSLVPEEMKEIVEENFKIRDLLDLEPIEVLKKIEDPECDMYELINDSIFSDYYSQKVTRRIFRGITDEELSDNLFREIRYGLGKYILENGLNIDLLGIETVDFIGARGITINLYNANGNEIEYVATLSSASEDGDFEVFRVCSEEERERLLEEKADLIPEGVILISESGTIIEYTGGNEYTLIDENGDVYENYGEVNYHKSYAEDVYKRVKGSASRYMNLQRLGAPYQILERELELMNNLKDEHTEMTRGKRKFVPKDIEKATIETTLEDVQKMIEEMTGPQITKEESLEKGIGFDEH